MGNRNHELYKRPRRQFADARMRWAADIVHMGAWNWDIDNGQFSLSEGIGPLFGLPSGHGPRTPEELLALVHPDDRDMLTQAMATSGGKHLPVSIEYRAIWPDRSVHWIEAHSNVMHDANGKPYGVGVAFDITQRKRDAATILRMRAEHDRIEAERLRNAKKLEKSLEDVIQAIAATTEMRDPYTAGHQKRVADLAVAIAREMGLPEAKIRGISLAGVIHDLGKIRIPAEILSKPGRLTDIEFQLMMTHPQTGYEILKDIEFPWPIATIVLQHHERWDGSGYPHRLKGERILLEARIIAIADVIESMASHRPYRPALGLSAALKEIETGRGRIYDPAVVDACLKLFQEGRFAFKDGSMKSALFD